MQIRTRTLTQATMVFPRDERETPSLSAPPHSLCVRAWMSLFIHILPVLHVHMLVSRALFLGPSLTRAPLSGWESCVHTHCNLHHQQPPRLWRSFSRSFQRFVSLFSLFGLKGMSRQIHFHDLLAASDPIHKLSLASLATTFNSLPHESAATQSSRSLTCAVSSCAAHSVNYPL